MSAAVPVGHGPHDAMPVFGLIVLGDEILSGRRADRHLPQLIDMLGQRALALGWAHMLGDDRARITALLRQVFASGDVVLCCGGIGATPDDHTRQAAAAALDVPLVRHAQAAALIAERMGDMAAAQGKPPPDMDSPSMRQRLCMADLPQGARIIPNPYNKIAGFSLGHVHFLPGFPVMAWPMMQWVLDTHYAQWQGQRAWLERALIVKGAPEATLTPLMVDIEARFDGVKVFSLPSVDHPVHGVHIELGVKGPPEASQAAFAALQQGLQAYAVVVAQEAP